MLHPRFVALTLILSLMATLACALPSTVIIPDTGLISTGAAQTVIAELTQSALSVIASVTNPLPTSTLTPEPPTITLTQTATATFTVTSSPAATFTPTLTATATLTPTPLIPLISVSVPTNCRTGPGIIYDRQGALLVGEVVQVYGRNAQGNYWYIRNPDSPSDFCWVWGQYATVAGNVASLPIYTPPPTPTPTMTATPQPDFNVSYSSMDNCNNGWWVELMLKNTGSLDFNSVGMTITDTVTDIVLADYADGFTDINGCLTSNTRDTLGAGKTYVISTPAFTYEPGGHKLRVTITLCSNTGQSGICLTKTINFTP